MTPQLVTTAPLAHLHWGEAGPWALLLHGIGGGRGGWDSTGAELAAAGCRVVAVDLPGYGGSPVSPPYSLAGFAAAVVRLLEALGAEQAALIGHSMGGMVAQELAARWPARVSALALVATSPAFGRPDGDWQSEFLAARCAPLNAGLGMAGLAAQLVPTMVAPGLDAARLAAARDLMAGVPEATYRRAVAALVGFDRRADLARIVVPTLVITGELDRTAPPEVARRMAERIAGSRCVIVPGAGHLLPIEQPQAFAAALLDFLGCAIPLHGADHGR